MTDTFVQIAHILPFSSSQDSEGYSYKVPESLLGILSPGDMVRIHLRDDTSEGIVAELRNISWENIDPSLKTIESIIAPWVLSFGQIQTILWYARTNCLHIHKVVSFFLPAPIRNRIIKYGITGNQSSEFPQKIKSRPTLQYLQNEEALLKYTASLLLEPGTVVIAASERQIQKLQEMVSFDKNSIGVFKWTSTDTQKAKLYLEIHSGIYTSLIGTRRLTTYNLSKYKKIAYLEDGLFKEILHSFHKYRIFDILFSLSACEDVPHCTLASVTPSIEVASLAIAKKLDFISFSPDIPWKISPDS